MEEALRRISPKHNPNFKTVIEWLPFQLDPSLPLISVNKMKRYEQKFGKDRLDSMVEDMKRVGLSLKPPVHFSYGGKVGNTLSSHRLIEYAKANGKQDEMVEKLFQTYFEKEGDIADLSNLIECAEQIGMKTDEVQKVLETKQYLDVVEKDLQYAKELQVTSVPTFIFNNRLIFSGARDADDFCRCFEELGFRCVDEDEEDSDVSEIDNGAKQNEVPKLEKSES